MVEPKISKRGHLIYCGLHETIKKNIDHATVQQILKIAQKASKGVQQKFTCITFDLAVAKMAYCLVCHIQLLFSDVIVHLGVFHIISAYLKAVGNIMACSGLEEILVDSKVCATGLVDGVINESIITDPSQNCLLSITTSPFCFVCEFC